MILIIQARCSSKRLKNKVLLKLNNIPVIRHLINTIKKNKKIKKIIVATSNQKTDDKLIRYLKKINILFYRGDLDNVAKRLCLAAKKYKAKRFMRISGDSPLIDNEVLNKALEINKKFSSYDLITNLYPRTFPKGQSVEIIKTSILEKNIKFMTKFEKEHVTKFFYSRRIKLKIKNFKTFKHFKFKNYCIDNKKDVKKIKKIMQND